MSLQVDVEDGTLIRTPKYEWAKHRDDGTWHVNWRKRISAADQLVCEFLKKGWGISDLGRTELWRSTSNKALPFVFIGFHAFFEQAFKHTEARRKVVILPINHSFNVNSHWFGALVQQLYLLVFALATIKENAQIFALNDYSLESTMCWNENDFAKLIGDLKEESKATTNSRKYQHNLEKAAY